MEGPSAKCTDLPPLVRGDVEIRLIALTGLAGMRDHARCGDPHERDHEGHLRLRQ